MSVKFGRIKKKGYLVFLMFVAITGSLTAQINQDIYFQYCEAHPRDVCFAPVEGAVDTVGRDVSELGGGYRFCLNIDSINTGIAPVRVMLVLDNSGSMCNHYGETDPEDCCVIGDSSGFCAKNDATNQRVVAANVFLDSLRQLSPESEVGVIVFSGLPVVLVEPVAINTEENVTRLKTALDSAGCGKRPAGIDGSFNRGTNLGAALNRGLTEVDHNVDEAMDRHVILLTDGGWDDIGEAGKSPEQIITNYRTNFPERALPKIHGVFISDSLTHVEHGYPAEGCAGNRGFVEVANLEAVVDSGKGIFFGRARPENIVARFKELLESMIHFKPEELTGMIVTNKTNGEVSIQGTIDSVGSDDPKQAHYVATLQKLTLEFGANELEIRQIIKKPLVEVPETTTTIVTIYRTKEWAGEIDENDPDYIFYCTKDTTSISITVTPPSVLIDNPFDVNAHITLKDKFIIDTVQVRAFTQNSDDQDNAAIGLFHFDDSLKNASGTAKATGQVDYSSDALFGEYALSGGSFEFPAGNLSGDFAFEAWVKPSSAIAQTELFKNSAFSFTIGSDRVLSFKAGDNELKTILPIDANAWSHVALSRADGTVTIFVNGINASESIAFNGSITGVMTITIPSSSVIDEIRISSAHRLYQDITGTKKFEIATLQNTTWIHGGTSTTSPMLTVVPLDWSAGNLAFQFSSHDTGRLVINFQHRGTLQETQWSKNGNPVTVTKEPTDVQGPYIWRSIFTRGDFGTEYDTFHVFFTEPVKCDSLKKSLEPGESFVIYDSIGVKKEDVFVGAQYLEKNCPDEWITEVRMKVKVIRNGIVPKRDSVSLIGTAVDTAGNYPDTTKRGPIEFGPGNGQWIRGIPNHPEEDPMTLYYPDMIKLGIPEKDKRSKLIILQTREVLAEIGVVDGRPKYSEKSVIYDPVGNIVCLDAPIRRSAEDDRLYYVVWNGLNKNNRRVASGAYLLRANIMYANDIGRLVPIQTKFNVDWGKKTSKYLK